MRELLTTRLEPLAARLTHWRTWADLGLLAAFAFSIAVYVPETVDGIATSLGVSPATLVRGTLVASFLSLLVTVVVISLDDDAAEESS